jgi:hypothetical protein
MVSIEYAHVRTSLKASSFKVRLGKSGLKVSRIILGCMSYGSKSWQEWVLEERDGIEHIKAAFAAGVNVSELDLFRGS